MVLVLVISAILVMVLIDYLLIEKRKKSPAFNNVNSSPLVFNKKSLLVPEGFYFSKGHTWIKPEEDGSIISGIDDFVIKALGKISISKTLQKGTKVKKGDVIIEGKFNSKTISFRSPIDGVISTTNDAALNNELTDPYGKNWVLKVNPSNLENDKNNLLSSVKANHWMRDEFRRLKDFLSFNSYKPAMVGITMYDGGNVIEGAVANLDENTLTDFQDLFLTV